MINNNDLDSALQILALRAKLIRLNLILAECYCDQTKGLISFNHKLYKSSTKYDFVSKIKEGNTLLVGEGNLSFTVSLIKKSGSLPNLIASTYEDYLELSEYAQSNTKLLKQSGIKVMHGLDATELHSNFYSNAFDAIIFQFPHSGSREGVNGINKSYILVKKFIVAASYILKRNGVVLISVVDSDYYTNMFRFEKLAKELRISQPVKYKFNPKDYPEYKHTMSHLDESAIDEYSYFATYEFKI